jgi:RHH-type transcriptional regulator, proline utilization regulon repressor / proline dehydrogenase / delta 1-pyrroline-5-carboxylate dehydrogenase
MFGLARLALSIWAQLSQQSRRIAAQIAAGFNGGVPAPSDEAATATAVALAEHLLVVAERATTRKERRRARRLGALLAEDAGREFLFALTDQVLRTPAPARAMQQLRDLVDAGLPDALPRLDRAALRLARLGSTVAPRPVAAVARRRIRAETRGVIVPADDPAFRRHVTGRHDEGFDVNVNLLGEAIVGDDEADARLDALCARMRRPDVAYVSVKVSALCANLDVLAFDHEVDRIAERLRTIYDVATESSPPVFVNLDMEEYRDLQLTVEAFCRVLDEPRYAELPAGIVLQAYLPDTHDVLERLAHWITGRRHRGGAPIKVRLVKGANLAMEHVDAELGGWAPATYGTKTDVDASFKTLLDRCLAAAAEGGLLVGVGSHNLFDVGWALAQRRLRALEHAVGIEMLEGMAPPQARATLGAAGGVVLYTPVVTEDDFAASIAYLSRRLDENSGPENFLRSLLTITPGSAVWHAEQRRFEAAVAGRRSVSTRPRRDQDRRTEVRRFDPDGPFVNEPDTDFTQAGNREWIAQHLTKEHPAELPPLVTTTDGIDDVVARARAASAHWRAATTSERRRALAGVAEVMAANRGRTIAVMAHETGKTVREGDPEVSEAIDFARWAGFSTHGLDELVAAGVAVDPLGVVLVAGPWNFPTAIPSNGVVTALAAGNAVLLKPAPEAVATAVELVRHIHEAGVPPDVVQLVRCPDDDVGRHLVTHPDVDGVTLTGSYETARMFLDWQPSLRLLAETSGKNAMVISQTADLDLALRDLVRSAFGHAGQKCSAASLAIVEAPLYDDATFRRRLADAVRSLRVGPATDLASMVGPIIQRATGKLARGLTQLDAGESWLVEPALLDGDRLWRPGVRLGVQPGSWFHHTECFGPVLGVMRADGLDHAIELQNAVEYGLTGGIHTLDDAEIEFWLERVQVGNAYVNRHTTGAVVRRQPFGGWKRSSVGRGAKTGGPDDIFRFTTFHPRSVASAAADAASYRHWWGELFGIPIDRSGLRAEANVFRYRPVARVLVRVGADTTASDVSSLRTAATVAGVPVEISGPPGGRAPVDVVEDDGALLRRLATSGAERLRLLAPCDDAVRAASHDADIAIDETPVTHHGRVELPCWLREQAISRTVHRHGRVP